MTIIVMETVRTQFKNRHHAGELLAEKIKSLIPNDNLFVFALPRGGVPIAEPIAKSLNQNINILLVKRIPTPGYPEVAIGAIVEDGKPIWQEQRLAALGMKKKDLERAVVKARQSISRRRHLWKVDSRVLDLKDQIVLIVDDGLATGATMFAAIDFLKKRRPQKVVVAFPVGHRESIEAISKKADQVIYLAAPEDFQAVGQYYQDFTQVTDREVAEILDKHQNLPLVDPPVTNDQNPIVKEVIKSAVPLKRASQFNQLLEKMSQCRIVMLGESTHGTSEFYQMRRILSQKLIENHGFKFIAVEGDWPDCWKLNQYIHSKKGKSARQIMQSFHRWPTWMWANEETEKLIEWMKGKDCHFYGLDVYSLFDSLDVVQKFSEQLDPAVAETIKKSFECFEPFGRNEKAYARSLLGEATGCQDEVVSALRQLLRVRLDQTGAESPELFNAQRNAAIVANAERYYRSMIEGTEESWNIRDEHMLQTLDALMQHHGEGSKAIVWAHNTHIGDYHATDMLKQGYINLGGIARERYGVENVFLLGFGTYEGEVLAGKAWGSPAEVMKLPQARPGSYESDFHEVAQSLSAEQFFVSFDRRQSSTLHKTQGHRAVGVVYETAYEKAGHNYVPTSLAERYDAFLFVDHTSALKPIATEIDTKELPETWPSGI